MTKKEGTTKIINDHGPRGFIFFIAYIGAAIYFVQQSSGFWGFIGALLKAMVWPAFVIYHALQALGA